METKKYGNLIKNLTFHEDKTGFYRQSIQMDSKFLGIDACVEYGSCCTTGKMGKAPFGMMVNDYDEVVAWMGVADPRDLGYLGAEVELCLGEERERHMITTSTAVAIPKGMPYSPATIRTMENPFIFMIVSCTAKRNPRLVSTDVTPGEYAKFGQSKYVQNVKHLAFTRNGPWHYGPKNTGTHGGAITNITGKDFEFHMSYESVRQGPYKFGPYPDRPHIHPAYAEYLLFMGMDTNDLSVLGAEIETTSGKEMETHTFNTPTVIEVPKKFPHGGTTVKKVAKPFIFAVIRPYIDPGVAQRENL